MKPDNNILRIVDLPEGAYFGKDDILYTKDGEKLQNDLYRMPNGDVVLYEGNFESMIIDS